jgi:Lrp/AsnC family leucine-responsive transcriptional regulator
MTVESNVVQETTMDPTDRRILGLLQHDARLTQAEIGRRVGLSAPAVNERIRRLERGGCIRRWTVLLDDHKVGADITAFVEVLFECPAREREFEKLVVGLPEIQEVHSVTGEFSCLLKMKVADRQRLRELLLDRINSVPGVRQTRTCIVLETQKEDPAVPIPDSGGTARRADGRKKP